MNFRKQHTHLVAYNTKTAVGATCITAVILLVITLISIRYVTLINSSIRLSAIFTPHFILSWVLDMIFVFLLFSVQFFAIRRFFSMRKKGLFTLGLLAVSLALALINTQVNIWFSGSPSGNVFSVTFLIKSLVLTVISFFFLVLIYLLNKNHESRTQNQALAIENLSNQYNALKNQIDPHFLFNSLNTLNGLIGYDDERAREYVQQLSAVFRYTMQNHSVMRLSEELAFAQSYIYLMKIRYGDESLRIVIRPMHEYGARLILPFGLQVLIENAVKHNVISRKRPLGIVIEITPEGNLRVENNLQPKQSDKSGVGLGLTNLNERYRLMFGKEIAVKTDEKVFAVEIPLVEGS